MVNKNNVIGYKIHSDSWIDTVSVFNAISKKGLWVFRGVRNFEWSLKTYFEREAEKHELDSYYRNTCESNIITAFQRQSKQYLQNLPANDEYIDWLALIQHYGGPTRLLDFTYSFYVAVFCALRNADSKAAVWAINTNSLIRVDDGIASQIPEIGYKEIIQKYVSLANNVLNEGQKFNESERKQTVYPVEPFFQEQRLAIQQGLFLFPVDIETSFMGNLSRAFGAQSDDVFDHENLEEYSLDDFNKNSAALSLIKIVLSNDLRCEAINQLQHMNISEATLFPGLDGFSRSLTNHFNDIKRTLTKPKN